MESVCEMFFSSELITRILFTRILGMPVGSPYRTSISRAILHLKEDGTIANLTRKWWEEENTDENGNQVDCSAGEKEASDTPELDMENVGGVFLVLGVGLLLAIFIGILEFIWSVRRVSIDEKVLVSHFLKTR